MDEDQRAEDDGMDLLSLTWWGEVDEVHNAGREPVPAGTYICEMVVDPKNGTRIVEGRNGRPQVKAVFRIAEGEYTGKWIFANYGVSDHPYSKRLMKTWLAAVGVTDELREALGPKNGGRGLPDIIPLLAGRRCSVTVNRDVPRDKNRQPLLRQDGTPYGERNDVLDVRALPGESPIPVPTSRYGFGSLRSW